MITKKDYETYLKLCELPPYSVHHSDLDLCYAGLGKNSNVTELPVLPEGITINGFVDFDSVPITELPYGFTAWGLDVCNTPLEKLPNGMSVGKLSIMWSGIDDLPHDLQCDSIECLDGQLDNRVIVFFELKGVKFEIWHT